MRAIFRRWMLGLGLVVIAVLGALLYWQHNSTNDEVEYTTQAVGLRDIHKSVLATGTVRSQSRVEVGAQVTGQLTALYVSLGQFVHKGDVIAEIDATTQQNAVNTAQARLSALNAQLRAANTTLGVAEKNRQRQTQLLSQRASSQTSLESAQTALAQAKAQVSTLESDIKQATIALATAQTDLGYTRITAPMSGTVVSIPVTVGQTLNARQNTPTVVQIADLEKMLIKAEVAEGDIALVKAGQRVRFTTLAEPHKTLEGVIDSVDPALTTLTDGEYKTSAGSSAAVYFYANILVPNPDRTLRIGMTTQTEIIVAESQQRLAIPNIAIERQGDKAQVQVLIDGKPQVRSVRLGLSDGIYTEVLEGVQQGELIITNTVRPSEGQNGARLRMPRL